MTRHKIIYVVDPMCSWCYGIAPDLKELRRYFEANIDFQLVLGGLKPYTKEFVDDNTKSMLQHHWLEVHERTGQHFSYELLERNDFVYDTEVPSRIIRVMRDINPDAEFDLLAAIQQCFYAQNKDTNLFETYEPLIAKYTEDTQAFSLLFESDAYKQKTHQDFLFARQLGISAFPSLILEKDQLYLLTQGYATSGELIQRVEHLLANSQN